MTGEAGEIAKVQVIFIGALYGVKEFRLHNKGLSRGDTQA